MSTEKEPKLRILEAAEDLFYERGFHATGVRALADRANVNQAMIHYYFGSKDGVLKALLEGFFDAYERQLSNALLVDAPLEERLRTFIISMIRFMRAHPKMARLLLTEPQVSYKAQRVQKIRDRFVSTMLPAMRELRGQDLRIEVMAPFMVSSIFAHFLQRPVLEQLDWVSLDDAFYEELERTTADLVLYGLVGACAPSRALVTSSEPTRDTTHGDPLDEDDP